MPDGNRSRWTHARAPELNPWREQDACGVGFVARASGERSSEVTRLALQALARVAHRGAAATDSSGDGAGVLTQIPHRLFAREAPRHGIALAPDGSPPFAVGAFFLPRDPVALARATAIVEEVLAGDGLPVLGWRDVPVDHAVLGAGARATCPVIRHAIVAAPANGGRTDDAAWERSLYRARRTIERRIADAGPGFEAFFVCSLSCRTLVYKALLTGTQLAAFFPDLRSPDYETALAVFHQRYSTNTSPSWALAQPFRLLAHNGEINTLWGNRNAMRARESALASPLWGESVDRLKPVIWAEGGDSTSLDNALELLVRSGRDPVHALMMLVPEAHEGAGEMEPALRGFYEFHECLVEPWDGPAALAFSDGVLVGSALDRNGLRPCRYKITRDGLVVAGSETGLVDLDAAEVVESGRLGPGELLVVDTRRKAILRNTEAKREVARRRPYARWAARGILPLRATAPAPDAPAASEAQRAGRQLAFGWSFEDLRYVLEPMGGTGQDAVWSMGDDTPIPPLARVPPSLYAYLRQRFAQVTNPPIDPLRETLVMSLRMHLGRRGSLLADRPAGLRLVRNEHPVLLAEEVAALRAVAGVQAVTLDATWRAAGGPDALRSALETLCRAAGRALRQGARILVLSDRAADREHAPVPMLVAVGAVHQHLLRKGLRTRLGLVAEAVYPWLALESARALVAEGDAPATFRAAAEKGLLKILSKMGISTLSSYCGAQIFEALGLGAEVIDRCFTGTVSTIGGIGFAEIAEDVLARQRAAYPEAAASGPVLPDHGRVRYRRDGEDHGWSPPLVRAMQDAVAAGTPQAYDAFRARVAARPPASPRDLLALRPGTPVPLDEVEPADAIRRRFVSTAMSLGALSPEAYTTLAAGMNRMGARSNSGEGGEDPDWYAPQPDGEVRHSRIKQVASARFGVTARYLVEAEELEIKMAQGSKPGEGGQLPGHKVTDFIARLRHAVPGTALISPPPHHDIYSIEDLAQLIHDLKQVNPRARVGVKLVAEAGVGTVAAGVAKAYADYVLVSGHNGGTGASPLSSIKHAGSPWELGVAETQQVLVRNGLRGRIRLRTDGGLRRGRDVVIAALLGAEEFGFGTAPLVALGCDMARQCHLNTCPTGIATQRAELRAKFKGTPDQVISFFMHLAEEVRELLASLGLRSIDEAVGRVDLLCQARTVNGIDLTAVLADPDPSGTQPRRCMLSRNDRPEDQEPLDEGLLREAQIALESAPRFKAARLIRNRDRTVGARIAGEIGAGRLQRPQNTYSPLGNHPFIDVRFVGSAGQSFGAFNTEGMLLTLEGEANDYLGKGMSGGEIVLMPADMARFKPHKNTIVGNTVLYGATGGRVFAAGRAGERFCVRNSGATAVVEGVGDHGCEYMTGGTVLVLGETGRNFGAGMTNGVAYVLDEEGDFPSRLNGELVQATRLMDSDELSLVYGLVQEHFERTASRRAEAILDLWDVYRSQFWKVSPKTAPRPAAPVPAASTA